MNKDRHVQFVTVFNVERLANMRNMLLYLLQTSCRVRYQVDDRGNGSLMTALGTLAFTWRRTPPNRAADRQKLAFTYKR